MNEVMNLDAYASKVTALDMSKLTDQERQQLYNIAKDLDVSDRQSIERFGLSVTETQAKIASRVADRISTNRLTDEVKDLLTHAVVDIKNQADAINHKERKGFFGFIDKFKKRASDKMFEVQQANMSIEQQINVVEGRMRVKIDELSNDSAVIDEMKVDNQNNYRDLSFHIAASELKLQEFEATVLPEARRKAEESNDMMDIQHYNELCALQTQMERRIHNLKNARQLAFNKGPQLDALQATNQELSNQLYDHISLSFPAWRDQLNLTAMLTSTSGIAQISESSSNFTNALITSNAKLLTETMVSVAKQSERGIVDAQSFGVVADELEKMLTGVSQAQEEGRRMRKEADVIFDQNTNRIQRAILNTGQHLVKDPTAQLGYSDAQWKEKR